MDIYQQCPTLENHRFLLRFVEEEDCADLLEVYSDKYALPFFNSDNCDGDNFYYDTPERMRDALRFWRQAYQDGWFVRWSVVDRAASKVIGTTEVCRRVSDDVFNGAGILRLDVKSSRETEDDLAEIAALIIPTVFEALNCGTIITKVPIYAIERIRAVQRLGFTQSEHVLIGKTGYPYDGYWTLARPQ
ncbi:MAG: GNAT family N-acetyltransferase [Oscillospiraceae bacterium]|jgi:ribosomal-protein-alanine N-acetyltransferase|nr:GNAT family N-acetyltransferase [Oscillospiraceae bacterium]MCI9551170.1 GNAT family N-acetyltransferase [Oscillospiraceae bacterium]